MRCHHRQKPNYMNMGLYHRLHLRRTLHSEELGFGVVSQPKELDLTIENDSTSTDTITGSVRIFSGETDFSIISGEGNFELSPAQSHVVTVRFSPTGPFTFNRLGTLRITHNASNRSSPINVPLSGGG